MSDPRAMAIPMTDPMAAFFANRIRSSLPAAVIYITPAITNPSIPEIPIIDNRKLRMSLSIEVSGFASVMTPAYTVGI